MRIRPRSAVSAGSCSTTSLSSTSVIYDAPRRVRCLLSRRPHASRPRQGDSVGAIRSAAIEKEKPRSSRCNFLVVCTTATSCAPRRSANLRVSGLAPASVPLDRRCSSPLSASTTAALLVAPGVPRTLRTSAAPDRRPRIEPVAIRISSTFPHRPSRASLARDSQHHRARHQRRHPLGHQRGYGRARLQRRRAADGDRAGLAHLSVERSGVVAERGGTGTSSARLAQPADAPEAVVRKGENYSSRMG